MQSGRWPEPNIKPQRLLTVVLHLTVHFVALSLAFSIFPLLVSRDKYFSGLGLKLLSRSCTGPFWGWWGFSRELDTNISTWGRILIWLLTENWIRIWREYPSLIIAEATEGCSVKGCANCAPWQGLHSQVWDHATPGARRRWAAAAEQPEELREPRRPRWRAHICHP